MAFTAIVTALQTVLIEPFGAVFPEFAKAMTVQLRMDLLVLFVML